MGPEAGPPSVSATGGAGLVGLEGTDDLDRRSGSRAGWRCRATRRQKACRKKRRDARDTRWVPDQLMDSILKEGEPAEFAARDVVESVLGDHMRRTTNTRPTSWSWCRRRPCSTSDRAAGWTFDTDSRWRDWPAGSTRRRSPNLTTRQWNRDAGVVHDIRVTRTTSPEQVSFALSRAGEGRHPPVGPDVADRTHRRSKFTGTATPRPGRLVRLLRLRGSSTPAAVCARCSYAARAWGVEVQKTRSAPIRRQPTTSTGGRNGGRGGDEPKRDRARTQRFWLSRSLTTAAAMSRAGPAWSPWSLVPAISLAL